jgi:CDP-diacylglycerol--glycerol-3-phosphate 3-phosphatidyltransferase
MNNENEIDKESRAYKFAAGKGVMNLPNKLTIARMVMIPVFILFFYLQFTAHYFVALAVFGVACLTDLFDGKIARKYNLVTNLGKFLDPIADKVLVLSALVIMLTVPSFFVANLGYWALIVAGCGVALILAREIIVSGFRMVAASSGTVIAADIFGKYKTTCQDISIVVLIVGAGVAELTDHIAGVIVNYVGLAFFALAVVLTVISGINYLVGNRAVLSK